MSGPQSNRLRNLTFYVVTNALRVLLPMATLPIFTRKITPTEYGILAMLGVLATVGIGLSNWGMLTAFNRYYFAYGRDPGKQLRLLGTILTFMLSCLVVIYLPVLMFRDRLSEYQTHSVQWSGLLLIVFANMALNHVNGLLFQYFKNAEKAGLFSLFELTRLVLNTVVALTLVLGFDMGIRGLALGGLIAQGIVLVAMVSRFRLSDLRPDLHILRECLAFGWPLMAKVVVNLVNISIDRQMIGKLKSMTDVGLYDRAVVIAIVVFTFMTTVQNVYGPRWNKRIFNLPDADRRSLGSLFTEYACLIVVPAVLLVLFCQEAVTILMPESYRNAVPLIALLATYYALLSFGKLFGPVTNYLKMTKFVAVTMVASYFVNIGLNFLLIPRYGAAGAVVSTCVGGLGSTLVVGMVCQRRYRVAFQWRPLMLLFGGLLIFAAVSGLTFYRLVPYWPSLVFRALLFVIYMVIWCRIVGWGMIRSIFLRGMVGVGLRPPPTLGNGES